MKGKGSTVLIIDDEPETLKYVGMNLKARGYNVLTAADGTEGLKVFKEHLVDLVLLDIGIPGPNGFQVCKHLSQTSDVPVIMLSARGQERDKVMALDYGADDYITKPFGVEELLARVRAALRRAERTPRSIERPIQAGDLEFDLPERRVVRRGQEIRLTPIEFSILSLLVRNTGKVLTHRVILNAVWGGDYGDEKEYVWAYICRLRAKLEDNPDAPRHILTEPGVGYRFASPSA